MTVIEIPDEQAAALKAKAAAQGFSLEGWLKNLAQDGTGEIATMATLDWSQCPDVESVPGKVSGAWVFSTSPPVASSRLSLPGKCAFSSTKARPSQSGSLCLGTQGRKIAIVVLTRNRWRTVQQMIPHIIEAVDGAGVGSYTGIEIRVK